MPSTKPLARRRPDDSSFRGRSLAGLLYLLREMEAENEIPTLPIYLDSPMALKALKPVKII